MYAQKFVSFHRGRHQKLRRRITGGVIIAVIILAAAFTIGKLTEDGPEYHLRLSIAEENHELRERITELNERVAELETALSERDAQIAAMPTPAPEEAEEGSGTESDFTAETPRD